MKVCSQNSFTPLGNGISSRIATQSTKTSSQTIIIGIRWRHFHRPCKQGSPVTASSKVNRDSPFFYESGQYWSEPLNDLRRTRMWAVKTTSPCTEARDVSKISLINIQCSLDSVNITTWCLSESIAVADSYEHGGVKGREFIRDSMTSCRCLGQWTP